ncbi:MAG TPA: hypothetical protein VJ870_20530 [Amycolatopsis sp.]|nr:hypothetical protein [Amycolatopsis sp.]
MIEAQALTKRYGEKLAVRLLSAACHGRGPLPGLVCTNLWHFLGQHGPAPDPPGR